MALTDKEQELLKVHLQYELDLLDFSFAIAAATPANTEQSLLRLMALDTFYVHARNLFEFYHGPAAEEKAAVAERFTDGPVEYPTFSAHYDAQCLSLVDFDLNDQVSHLNPDRGTNAKLALNGRVIDAIKGALDDCLKLFQLHLSADALDHWKPRRINYLDVIQINRDTSCTAIYENLTSTCNLPALIYDMYLASIHANGIYIRWE